MRRIYIVEDEAVVALGLRAILRELGYEVCGYALRAAVALEEVPRLAPDLVLMDIHLGPGPSGIEVAEALRERGETPIVFVTAYSDGEPCTRAARSDAFAYVVKPFHPQELRANIELALLRQDTELRLRTALEAMEEVSAALRLRTLELERTRSLLQATLEASDDGLMAVDPGGRVAFLNPRFEALWELPAEIVATGSAAEILHWCAGRVEAPDRFRAEHLSTEGYGASGGPRTYVLRDGRRIERAAAPHLAGGVPVGQVLRFREVSPNPAQASVPPPATPASEPPPVGTDRPRG